MSRRKKNAAPMSLFSFQDIITATTGILILLALVLALSVIIQGAESEIETEFADDTQVALRDQLREEIAGLNLLLVEFDGESTQWANLTPSELKSKVETQKSKKDQLLKDITETKIALATEKKNYADLDYENKTAELSQQVEQQQDEISEAVARFKELKLTDRIVYNFRANTKAPWLVQIADAEIIACKLGSKNKPREFQTPWDFNKFSTSLNPTDQYFVLFLKPSGIENYDEINRYLRKQSYDIGLELIGEKQTVIDPIKGMTF